MSESSLGLLNFVQKTRRPGEQTGTSRGGKAVRRGDAEMETKTSAGMMQDLSRLWDLGTKMQKDMKRQGKLSKGSKHPSYTCSSTKTKAMIMSNSLV
eukprot:3733829-Amphidinium_carterae.1